MCVSAAAWARSLSRNIYIFIYIDDVNVYIYFLLIFINIQHQHKLNVLHEQQMWCTVQNYKLDSAACATVLARRDTRNLAYREAYNAYIHTSDVTKALTRQPCNRTRGTCKIIFVPLKLSLAGVSVYLWDYYTMVTYCSKEQWPVTWYERIHSETIFTLCSVQIESLVVQTQRKAQSLWVDW